MTDTPVVASPNTTVHVFTDEQFKQLLSTITPGPGFVAKTEDTVKQGAAEVVANFKTLVADVENTLAHVHGAAKQLQVDVKSNIIQIVIGIVAFSALALNLLQLFSVKL